MGPKVDEPRATGFGPLGTKLGPNIRIASEDELGLTFGGEVPRAEGSPPSLGGGPPDPAGRSGSVMTGNP